MMRRMLIGFALLLVCFRAVQPASAEFTLRNDLNPPGSINGAGEEYQLTGSVSWIFTGQVTDEPWVLIQGFWTPAMSNPSSVEESHRSCYSFMLRQNYPNPCRPRTAIEFAVPGAEGSQVHTSLIIYDVSGRQIRQLLDQEVPAGFHRLDWRGHNDAGEPVSSGVYFCKLTSGQQIATKRLIVLK